MHVVNNVINEINDLKNTVKAHLSGPHLSGFCSYTDNFFKNTGFLKLKNTLKKFKTQESNAHYVLNMSYTSILIHKNLKKTPLKPYPKIPHSYGGKCLPAHEIL